MQKWFGRVGANPISMLGLISILGLSFANPASAQQSDKDICFKGSGQEAIAACSRQISRLTGENLAIVYHSRGYEYLRLGQFDLAIADFTQSIRIDPSSLDPYVNRCVCLRAKGEFAKAAADANSALRIDPNDRYARTCLEKAQRRIRYPAPN